MENQPLTNRQFVGVLTDTDVSRYRGQPLLLPAIATGSCQLSLLFYRKHCRISLNITIVRLEESDLSLALIGIAERLWRLVGNDWGTAKIE
jgi:hypothetical protein